MNKTTRVAILVIVLVVPSWVSSAGVPTANLKVCTPGVTATSLYLYIARDRGYFAREGLKVEIIAARGLLCITAMMANEINFTSAPTTFELMVSGKFKGKVLYNPTKGLAHRLIVAPDVKNYSDLKQKSIAISTFGTLADLLTREILGQSGLTAMKDVMLLQIGTPDVRYAALRSNKVQGALLVGYHAIKALDEGFRELEFELPPYLSAPLIIGDDTLAREGSMVRSFLRAAMKGHYLIGQRPDEALVVMQKALGVEDRTMARKLFEDDMRRYNPGGRFEEPFLRKAIERVREEKGIKREVDVKEVFDLSHAAAVDAELRKEKLKF